jgi:outer membrane protein
MRWFLRIFAVSLVVCMHLPDAFPQGSDLTKPLTLEECIDIALKRRPELEVASLDILNSEYQIKEANSNYYPHLSVTTGYTRFNRPEKFEFSVDISAIQRSIENQLPFPIQIPSSLAQEVEVGKTDWAFLAVDLLQPIYTFGRIEEGVKQARIGRSYAVNQREKKKGEIIFEVKKGYHQVLLAREIHNLMKDAELRAGIAVKMVRIGYETSIPEKGEKGTSRLDYLKMRGFHAEIRTRLTEAEKNVKLAELALMLAMGVDPAVPLGVAEIPLQSLPLIPRESRDLKGAALERNIDLKNSNLGVDLYDSKRRAAVDEYYPKIGLQGQYVGPEDRWGTKNQWYAGIGVTMPIFDGYLTKAKVGQAEAQLKKAKTQKSLLETGILAQIDHLSANVGELKERINILSGSMEEARERSQLSADGYAAGSTDFDEILDSQRFEIQLKASYLQSLYQFHVAQSEIDFISGLIHENR